MGLFKTRLKCEGAKNNQCVLGCPVLQRGCIKVELGEKCKSRRGEEERYRNPDINVAAARRDQIGDWDLGELGGALVKGLVWFGVSGCSMAHLLCWSLVRPIFRDIGSKENIVGRLVSLLAGEWDIGVEME